MGADCREIHLRLVGLRTLCSALPSTLGDRADGGLRGTLQWSVPVCATLIC